MAEINHRVGRALGHGLWKLESAKWGGRVKDTVRALRDQLEKAGQLVNRVLQIDLPFDSQSGALKFLNGTSLNGNECWKTVNGDKPLKQLL